MANHENLTPDRTSTKKTIGPRIPGGHIDSITREGNESCPILVAML